MVSLLDWQLAIYNRVKDGLPNTPVYLEGIGESMDVTSDPSGFVKPSVIMWFGQAVDMSGFGGRITVSDMCGVLAPGGSSKKVAFIAQAVAPSGLALLQVSQAVRELLTGFRPVGQGELSEAGSGTVRDPYPVGIGNTLRFYVAVGYQGIVNVGGESD